MKKRDNLNQELIFKIEISPTRMVEQYRSKRTVKSAERNLKKMLLNRIDGKTGEC